MSAADEVSAQELGVLQALWEAHDRDVPMGELLRQTGSSWPAAQAALDALAARGCRIERTPGGVSLATAGINCWRAVIECQARRRGWRVGRTARVYPEIPSTNDAAWQAAGTGDGDGCVVLANHQTAGRGRLGRVWHAQAGQSVLMSVLLHGVRAEALDRLTLLAGLATAVGLEHAVEAARGTLAGAGRIDIKWPNDLLVGGRKLAGILVEARQAAAPSGPIDAAVVGIGINVAQGPGDFPPEVGPRGVSLFQAAGLLPDRLRVVEAVLASLDAHLVREPDDEWLAQWKERCGMLGRRLTARQGERVITGQVLDVAPLHGLIVRDDQGHTHLLSARTCSIA